MAYHRTRSARTVVDTFDFRSDRYSRFLESLQVKNSLSQLSEERGWSQGDLADKLGVSRQTVNALERGKYDPSLPLAFKIAQLFKLRFEEIFDPDETPNIKSKR